MLTLSACENSMDDIQKIASKEEDKPYSTSHDIEVIYSDSAKVKARMTSPLMIELDDGKSPYHEMPEGVKIVFYDDNLAVKGTLTADYAIMKDKENIIDFKRHVVLTNAQGQTFKSEELIDDQNNKKFYTDKPVEINMGNGEEMQGVGAHCNASMYPWTIERSTGIFPVDDKDDPAKQ
jgi:LPS export ABC transporter protein LptC